MTAVVLKANTRKASGTGSARSLRRDGMVPAVIYGKGKEELFISLTQKEVQLLQNKFTFFSTPLVVEVDGKKYNVLPKAVSLHPVTDMVEHVDFVFLDGVDTVKVKVPLLFTGRDKSVGLKRGGVFNIVQRSLEVKVSPKNIPSVIEVNIADVGIGIPVRFKDISLPANCVATIKDPNYTIAKLVGKKVKGDEAAAGGA